MKIIERIYALLDEQGKRPVDLVRALGVTNGQMTNWRNRQTDPPTKYVIAICRFLEVTPEYLLTGEERPASLGGRSAELLRMYNALPASQQDFIYLSIRAAYDAVAQKESSTA